MKIEEVRKKYNFSRADLCRWLGIPYRTLENWEKGTTKCPQYMENLIVEKIERDAWELKSDNSNSSG